ncbi:MAG: L-threonylcarbamoyladenylate synthase [Cyanobium sp.]
MNDPARADSPLNQAPAAPLLAAPLMAAHLRGGGAALLPTDTLPALAIAPAQASRIWELKRRPPDKPLILMAADLEQLQQWLASAWPDPWQLAARRHWPGALTLVLPIRGPLTDQLHPGGTTLGVRVPACPPMQELLRLTGPLATTSVNLSGKPAATSAQEASRQFPDLPLLAPLPWPQPSGQASAVWLWQGEDASGPPWRVLRAGAITPEDSGLDPAVAER